jgi:hypothetical protein
MRDPPYPESTAVTSPIGPLSAILGSYPLSRLSGSMLTTSTATKDDNIPPRQMYSLSFVVIVAIISFLLGSLIRSLLTPGYELRLDREGVDQVERALLKVFDGF